ncbi:hypothetical protein [Proteiniphilum sp. UBA5384]|uniref:hypothetical protein n=1 Tax=Proteiniphilum sp. UBA5384 TaxID=1947279 RepID=UPI0025E47F4F|nr:hypothetical protein [Proteiniphilum sp. UBA5384]
MMKWTIYYFILVLFFSSMGAQGCSEKPVFSTPDPEGNGGEVLTEAIHGVCRMNLQNESYEKVVAIANNIVQSNIPVIRINGVKEGGSIDQVIHNINTFSQKGGKVVLMQPMWMEMFPDDYEQIPGPSFLVYKMSDIVPDRFRIFMDRLLEQIVLHTPEGALIGLELFNEVNQAGYNGDLQPTPEGKGEIFNLDTPLDRPSFQDAYAGINKYGKCLEITRDLLNIHFPKKNIKLVTHGIVSSGGWINFQWHINRGVSLVLPDMFLTILQGSHPQQQDKTNYLRCADVIGLHCYPPLANNMSDILYEYYFDPINAVLEEPMPYWITEWGFAKPQFEDNGGEMRRLQYFRSFIQAIGIIGNTEMTVLFDFDLNKDHRIWENGVLLESGTIFQEIN